MGASLAFERAVASTKLITKQKTKIFYTEDIVNFLNKQNIKTIHDSTYWVLKFKVRGHQFTINGYEKDDNFEGYLYNRKYYKTQQGVINQLNRDFFS